MRCDLLIRDARVFGHPGASSVAVSDGAIVAVGIDPHEVEASTTIAAARGLVLPGFHDAHVHPTDAGLAMLTCNLEDARSIREYRDLIAAYARNSGDGWITGRGWRFDAFPDGIPTANLLDDLTAGRPAFLMVADGHTAWVNSTALHIAGITRDTPDPADGRIERHPDGSPNGCLQEGAMALVQRHVPPPTSETMRRALLAGQEQLIALGITGWQDAWVEPDVQKAYLAADAAGQLIVKVRGALLWDGDRGMEQVPDLIERRGTRSTRFEPSSVKLLLDGVCENQTAALLVPYTDRSGTPTANSGLDFIGPKDLIEYVSRLHAEDFQVHFHSLGNRAVRHALDAVEEAIRRNGPKDLRHHLAHIQIVDPADVPRFAALDAIANAQPLWAVHEEAMDDLTIPFLGECAAHQYPFASLSRSGAKLAMGSDWPVTTADPLQGIEVAVHRTHPETGLAPFLPDEAIALDEALLAYTAGSAFASHMDDRVGRIAPGMDADLTILDGDPFSDGHTADLSVTHTIIDGVIVYRSEP